MENQPLMNTPQDCVRYALEFEQPPYPCIRVILSHGTFVDLQEWAVGESNAYEGRVEWISDNPDQYDEEDEALPESAEPAAVLLTQSYTGDHIEANNGIFNWIIDDPSAETSACHIAMEYRKADRLQPQIAEIVVSLP